jgi:pimeloyl-ACP methyl ester carboxylesterase
VRRLTVRRPLVTGRVDRVMRAQLERSVWSGDPRSVWGLDFEDVALPGQLGPLPAWHVPARRDVWVVLVHGHGGDRRRCLRPLPTVHDTGLPALVIGWRNDGIGPAGPDGIYHLGDTEWRDLEVAVQWALSHGARRLVLYGFSMGGAIVGAFLRRSTYAPAVDALVLDAPVLDWRALLAYEFRELHVPLPVTPLKLTAWLTELRIGARLDELNLIDHPEAIGERPTLLFQGLDDPVCPPETSRALARRLPERVRFVGVPAAGHEASWNVDPPGYQDGLRGFLEEVAAAG